MLQRLRNLLLFPKYEWQIIALEKTSLSADWSFVFRLLTLAAITQFIGSFFYVTNSLQIAAYAMSFPVVQAVFFLAIYVILILAVSLVMHAAFRGKGASRPFPRTLRLVLYSLTPLYMASVLANLHPYLTFLLVAGAYSVYLFWTGGQVFLKHPREKMVGVTFIFVITVSSVLYILTTLFNQLTVSIFSGVN